MFKALAQCVRSGNSNPCSEDHGRGPCSVPPPRTALGPWDDSRVTHAEAAGNVRRGRETQLPRPQPAVLTPRGRCHRSAQTGGSKRRTFTISFSAVQMSRGDPLGLSYRRSRAVSLCEGSGGTCSCVFRHLGSFARPLPTFPAPVASAGGCSLPLDDQDPLRDTDTMAPFAVKLLHPQVLGSGAWTTGVP